MVCKELNSITIIRHPPHSPDLSPCDFWLFDLIKQDLGDNNNSESLCQALSEFMDYITKEEYRKKFDTWIERIQLCGETRSKRKFFQVYYRVSKCQCHYFWSALSIFHRLYSVIKSFTLRASLLSHYLPRSFRSQS